LLLASARFRRTSAGKKRLEHGRAARPGGFT